MNKQLNLRNAALVAALAAVTATAWATNEYSGQKIDEVIAKSESAVTPAESVAAYEGITATDSVTANETVVATESSTPAPVVERNVTQAPITIEDRRMTLDERIQAQVMDKLANAPNISGKIGVESHGAVVTLTGYTVTAAQGQRAGRYAGSIEGVKSVQNEIRARIGGSV